MRCNSEGGILKQAAPAPNTIKLLRRCLTVSLTLPENCSLELVAGNTEETAHIRACRAQSARGVFPFSYLYARQ